MTTVHASVSPVCPWEVNVLTSAFGRAMKAGEWQQSQKQWGSFPQTLSQLGINPSEEGLMDSGVQGRLFLV